MFKPDEDAFKTLFYDVLCCLINTDISHKSSIEHIPIYLLRFDVARVQIWATINLIRRYYLLGLLTGRIAQTARSHVNFRSNKQFDRSTVVKSNNKWTRYCPDQNDDKLDGLDSDGAGSLRGDVK